MACRTHAPIAAALTFGTLLSGCAAPQPRDSSALLDPAAADLAQLTAWMQGSFSSAEQAVADAQNFFDIRLEMVQIWPRRTDGTWLYVEQAASQSLDKPYRQRIYRVTPSSTGSIESAVFELPGDALAFAGAWKTPEKFDTVQPEALQPRTGCTVVMRKQPDGTFAGRTIGTGCTSSLRGAKYATSEVTVTADGLRTWDRGYNEANEQVWGAKTGPYEFKRVRTAPPTP